MGSEMKIERPITAEKRRVSAKLTMRRPHNICDI